jgi:hypothetical protein
MTKDYCSLKIIFSEFDFSYYYFALWREFFEASTSHSASPAEGTPVLVSSLSAHVWAHSTVYKPTG